MMRKIILHRHLFKNAGSTFDWSLKRNVGDSFVYHTDDHLMRRGKAKYLAAYIKAHPGLKALSSHHLCNPVPEMDHVVLISVVFLRHPIERIWSVYNYEKNQKGNTPGSRKAGNSSFKEYVEWRMKDDVNPTIRNFHLRQCTSLVGKPRIIPTERHLKEAISYLNKTMFVGIVEKYDQSMVLFERMLERHSLNWDLSYFPQNVASSAVYRRSDLDRKLQLIAEQLGDLYETAVEKNALDLKLYEHGNKLLKHRIQKFIPDLPDKMETFQKRCAGLLA